MLQLFCDLVCNPGFRWPHAAIMLLLEEYRQREENMSSGKITHKKAWDQIAEVMNANGYFVTGKQCTTRINTMKRTYKAVKDHNGKSGNNKRTWQYFEVMERFLGEKPYMAPLSTVSSTGAATSRGRSASISSVSSSSSVNSCAISDIVLDDNDHVPRKLSVFLSHECVQQNALV
ncbi:uncharacterized protein LOC115235014 [Formica exsecta]|uniref:uncharacterized protein LOC115235014 n=1 Tax=Formica exsecta TaxID=72781 RepID=UPI0011438ED0|nr:uncharacterized protein LOC115235014 [Formica exsecta]